MHRRHVDLVGSVFLEGDAEYRQQFLAQADIAGGEGADGVAHRDADS
jgi:hypothetical protein